ncbi:MAG TPA: GNAT family N-acetyltransferase [Candidatus Elarobacter sp.]
MIAISSLVTADCEALVPALVRLTVDAVDGGASLGWDPPLDPDAAARYWEDRIRRFDGDDHALFAAFAGDDLVGAVQRERGDFPTTRHRAEVAQLMVLRAWRRRGIARALMDELEDDAFVRGIALLVLATPPGEPAEALSVAEGYERTGYVRNALKHADGTFSDSVSYGKLLR